MRSLLGTAPPLVLEESDAKEVLEMHGIKKAHHGSVGPGDRGNEDIRR